MTRGGGPRLRILLALGPLAALGASCPEPTPPHAVYPADRLYADVCPAIDVHRGEVVELTWLESHHRAPEMTVATCDEALVPGCATAVCAGGEGDGATPGLVCLPGKVYRKLLAAPAGAELPSPGTRELVPPFCSGTRCTLGLGLWVSAPDGSILRWTDCRLLAGEVVFVDREDPARTVRLDCKVASLRADGSERRCYPFY